jgi:predicted nuclease of restriction endonuclease-like (RecB) superfamily
VSGKLTWSHIVELLSITNKESRAFYIQRCEDENWSVRILKRNIDTSLYERYVLSSDKEELNPQIKHKNNEIWKQIIKDPYVFEFLDLPKDKIVKEKDLEKRLLDNIEVFLLELGKGFSFVARQFSINIDKLSYKNPLYLNATRSPRFTIIENTTTNLAFALLLSRSIKIPFP